VKSQNDAVGGDSGAATLTTPGFSRGLFRTQPAYGATAGESEDSGQFASFAGWRAFSRNVGARYSLQSFLNSVPLLIVDVCVLW
jgi:hypothetical protein